MRGHSGQKLKPSKEILLATVGFLTVALPVGLGVLNGGGLRAQTLPTNKDVAFEVASVKPNKSGDRRVFGGRIDPGGRYTVTNSPLRRIIRSAYADEQNFQLESFRLFGGPSWIESESFDITAKAPGNPSRPQFKAMLRNLLAERFKLVVHTETRNLPIYRLVMARNDGNLGPQLRRTEIDCAAILAAPVSGKPPEPGKQPPCGTIQTGRGRITGRGRPMETLAGDLSAWVNRTVEDQTGLAGYFDVDLEWTPTECPADGPFANERPTDTGGPSLFTALQEQLGLKLESARAPVEVLIIDSVKRPTPD